MSNVERPFGNEAFRIAEEEEEDVEDVEKDEEGSALKADENYNGMTKRKGVDGGEGSAISHSHPSRFATPDPVGTCKILSHFPSPLRTDHRFILPPRQRQRWGDPQEAPHVNWGDLFFDLFYVGLAYKLAALLKDAPTSTGVLYFAGCFGPVMMEWIDRMWFDSRFWVDDDPVHRIFEVLQLCLLATAVLHIGTVDEMSHPSTNPEMWVFSLCLSVMNFCKIVKYAEVWVWCQGGGPESKIEAKRDIRFKLISLPFFVAAAAVSGSSFFSGAGGGGGGGGYGGRARRDLAQAVEEEGSSYADAEAKGVYGYDASSSAANVASDVPIYLCLAGWIVSNAVICAQILYWTKNNIDHKRISVPMNISFVIHRYGEWTMLMLGESILSLIISTNTDDDLFYASFYAGVLSTILLQYLHYRSQPHTADHHALRRSKLSGLAFTLLMQVYSGALVALGASFKMLLYEYSYSSGGGGGHRRMIQEETAAAVGDDLFPSSASDHVTATTTRFLAADDYGTAKGYEDEYYDGRKRRLAYFHSASLAVVLVCLELMILSHRGLYVNANRCRCPETKRLLRSGIIFALTRCALIVFVACLGRIVWEPEEIAWVGFACLVLEVFTRMAGDVVFPDLKVHSDVGRGVGGHGETKEGGGDAAGDSDDDEEQRWPNVTQPMPSYAKEGN